MIATLWRDLIVSGSRGFVEEHGGLLDRLQGRLTGVEVGQEQLSHDLRAVAEGVTGNAERMDRLDREHQLPVDDAVDIATDVGEAPYPGTTAQAVLGKIIASKPVSAMEERGTGAHARACG